MPTLISTSMSHSFLTRMAGPLCVAAAVLIVLSQLLRLGLGGIAGAGSVSTVAHTATYAIALLGMAVLLLALTGLYLWEAPALGRLGLAGYLTAFLGTLLVAGDWWFEAFVVPALAAQAPQILAEPPGASVLAGAVATIVFCTAGWIMFGIAAFRAAVFPRPAAVLLVVAGLAGVLTLWTPWQIPLAVAVGWIGVSLRRCAASTGTCAGTAGHRADKTTSSQDNAIRDDPVPGDGARLQQVFPRPTGSTSY
jgi:hypothetical protein